MKHGANHRNQPDSDPRGQGAEARKEFDPDLIFFDGQCGLCSRLVRFVFARDPGARYRFVSMQSDTGSRLLAEIGLSDARPDTFVLLRNGKPYVKSTAALQVARTLTGLWPLLYAFIVIPAPVRDWVYDQVARNRYRWFGKTEQCMVPSPEMRSRFLE